MQDIQLPVISDPNAVVNIRPMSKSELKMVFEWSAKEGWNPGKYEADAFYAINPKGYMALTINNELIASLLNIRYSPKYAFMALYIVKSEFRGKGFGKMLWDVVIDSLADCETVGFSGVLERVEDYKSAGFEPYFFDTRWCGKPKIFNRANEMSNDIVVKKFTDSYFKKLVDYDSKIFAIRREDFLAQWFLMPEASTWVAVDSTGEVCGYGVISASTEGYKIAPLYAENEIIAEKLLYFLCNSVDSETPIYMDIPESNVSAIELAKRIGLKMIFKTMRMYRGLRLQTQDEKMFSLTGLELG